MKEKIFESDLFGKIPQPSSFEKILGYALDPHPDKYRAVRMWRGQSNIEWPVNSTAHRRLSIEKPKVKITETSLQFYEQNLLKHADHKGFRMHEGSILSDMELLAKLRHHGAATRLVDATKNMLVALWFCASDHPSNTGLLLGLHAHYLGGYEGERNDENYKECMKNIEKYDYPLTWEPTGTSLRVSAQHSQFLYSSTSDNKSGSLLFPKDDGAVLAIAITPKLKKECLKILQETFDVRRITLFPDLDGFCYSNSAEFNQWSNNRW